MIFTDHRRIEKFDLNNITDDKRAEGRILKIIKRERLIIISILRKNGAIPVIMI